MVRPRDLLYITNAYPPQPFAGTLRVAKTVKYLARAGVAVRVLTTYPHAEILDESLLPDVAYAAEVIRTVRIHPGPLVAAGKQIVAWRKWPVRSAGVSLPEVPVPGSIPDAYGGAVGLYNRLHALLFTPDETIGWLPFALPAGAAMIRRHRPDVILSTGPGHACHLIGALLSRWFGIPHVVEFRDPWCGNPLRHPPTAFHAWLEAHLERFALASSSGVVTIGETMGESYRARSGVPVETIRNGYDPEDLQGADSPGLKDGECDKEVGNRAPVIAHAGTFYAGRSPRPFLAAVARRRAAGRVPVPRLLFMGPGAEAIRLQAEAVGIADLVETTGPLAHDACLARLAHSDVLLLVPGQGAGTITGKVFEYLALGHPILALATAEQEVASLLAATPAHALAAPGDDVALDAALTHVLTPGGPAARPDPHYSRPFQAFRLHRFLASVIP